ncbi:MAG: LysM peptidoglycan-binding domain-containing protein [Anaerolineae bacterium]
MKGSLSFRRKVVVALVTVLVLQLLLGATVSLAAPPASDPAHVVRSGETLFSIGRRYGVSPWAIARANGLRNPDLIYAGQVLYIPSGGSWGSGSWGGYWGRGCWRGGYYWCGYPYRYPYYYPRYWYGYGCYPWWYPCYYDP